MAIFISKQEKEEMEKTTIDEETGMTKWDWFEWNHAYEDVVVM